MEKKENVPIESESQSENIKIESRNLAHLKTIETNVSEQIVFRQQESLLIQQNRELEHKLAEEIKDNELKRGEQIKDNELKRRFLGVVVICSISVLIAFFYFVYLLVTSEKPSETLRNLLVAISFLAGASATFLYSELWKILKKDEK